MFSRGNIEELPRTHTNGRQRDQIGTLDCFNSMMSAKEYLSHFLTKIFKKNLESKLLQLLVGEGVRGLIGNRY